MLWAYSLRAALKSSDKVAENTAVIHVTTHLSVEEQVHLETPLNKETRLGEISMTYYNDIHGKLLINEYFISPLWAKLIATAAWLPKNLQGISCWSVIRRREAQLLFQ